MGLVEYIEQIGDAKAAKLWNVEERTVQSWRLRERTPRPNHAARIVETSPVTYEGIYGLDKPN
jgi:hypothetical protein